MGSAQTYGENRARRAAEEALNSPLLNNQNVNGAEKILLSIMSGEEAELQMDELADITDYMQEFAGDDAEVIFGHGVDQDLGENIRVTVIATGFGGVQEIPTAPKKKNEVKQPENKRVYDLEGPRQIQLFENEKKQSDDEDEEEEETTSKEDLFRFDFLKDEIKKAVEKEDELDEGEFEFDLGGDYEVFDEDEEDEVEEEKERASSDIFSFENITRDHDNSKRLELMEQRRRREQMLEGTAKQDISSQNYKDKFDVPAYERKKVTFSKVPHSSERNISRFNLTDDNQILGNNKYLHDNVD